MLSRVMWRGWSLSQTTVGRWQLGYHGKGRQEGGGPRARTLGPGWGGKNVAT